MIEVVLCVLAAAAYAVGSVLQRRGAVTAPRAGGLRLGLVVDLLRRPVWLAGIAAMIAGVVLQVLALHQGALALVEPILILELPLTLLLAALIFRVRLDGRTAVAILLMTGSLAALLLLAHPSGGHAGDVPGSGWGLSLIVAGGVMGVLVAVGLRSRPAGRAALLGVASGLGHGLAATLIKATTALAAQGWVAVLSSWQLYVAIAAGGLSLYLFQVALQSGPLAAAQAGMNILDPLTSTCFGLLLFGESVRGGFLVVPEAASGILLVLAVVVLARSPLLHEQDDERRSADRKATRSGRTVVS